ncbi:EF-hand domain-containing protein [uncultured Thiodictyon sp.]|uniref:EF-hand domain-containing protein n=1 Tax=uncultured Thiodictyon sp. TaxID=1846217 RepID=UPI0025E49C20|nr:EF-hand domain-containing protein [uncultured Thiodictyon sp.]
MNHKTQMLVLSLAITAACAVQPALAESENVIVGGPLPFTAYDRDGNGSISAQEFNRVQEQQTSERAAAGAPMGGVANTTTFAVFDRNSDGQVTAAEFTTVQPPAPASGPGTLGAGPQMGLSDGGGVAMPGALPTFTDLDENHDGSLSASEFNDARANRAVEKSQQGQPIGSLRNAPTFEAIDLNSDGRISAEEFATVQAQHSPPQPQR